MGVGRGAVRFAATLIGVFVAGGVTNPALITTAARGRRESMPRPRGPRIPEKLPAAVRLPVWPSASERTCPASQILLAPARPLDALSAATARSQPGQRRAEFTNRGTSLALLQSTVPSFRSVGQLRLLSSQLIIAIASPPSPPTSTLGARFQRPTEQSVARKAYVLAGTLLTVSRTARFFHELSRRHARWTYRSDRADAPAKAAARARIRQQTLIRMG